MINWIFKWTLVGLCGAVLLTTVATARAHMLWLNVIELDGRPQAFMYFGENAADDAYHMPERIAGAEVWSRTPDGKRTKLVTKPLDAAGRIGQVSPLADSGPCVLEVTRQYGNYHGMLLTYYAKHVRAMKLDELASAGASKELLLDIVPRVERGELTFTVLKEGKPLAGADLTISVTGGEGEPAERKTGENGTATWRPNRAGLVSVLASYRDPAAKGEINGEAYTGSAHFATLTLEWRDGSAGPANRDAKKDAAAKAADRPRQTDVPALPEPLASFGAAVADGWLYVYGGHTGEPHDHSAANLSKHFRRAKLVGSREWEELPMQIPLQGLAMVAHQGRVYRIGGMNARNATTAEDADLHSTKEFACYDPKTQAWTLLEPLPAGRSSHDAVVIGDKLYVVGGWTLAGPSRGTWADDGLVFDFAKPKAGWQKIEGPAFRRRALAVGEWRGKVVAIGGIDEDGAVVESVHLFDPATGKWSDGPSLPAGDMAGFGASAWNLTGNLYVSGLPGSLYRLNDEGKKWEGAARLATPRFFHRLMPGSQPNRILVIAGAAEDGHVADVESIDVSGTPKTLK